MPIDVTMPKLSDTMEEGKVLKWLKHVGDAVAPGDILAEVETDKAEMELEAYDEGTLSEVRTQEGETVPVGSVIAILAAPGEQASAPVAAPSPKSAAPKAPTPAPAPAATTAPARPAPVRLPPAGNQAGRVAASPLARRLAAERGVDLAQVAGTGPGGRIVERDITGAPASAPAPAVSAARAPAPSPSPSPGGRRVELSKMRRTTARRMAEAKRDVPHFYVSAEIAMDEAERMREELRGQGGEWDGVTVTHLLLKAVGLALRAVPEMNASLDGEGIILHAAANVGLATATDDGLIVPVVRGCDVEPLLAIVRQARGLVERARAGKFAPDDLTGGTFTISNLGMYPVAHFAAVVNPPQAAILAVGTIRSVPVVRGDAIVPGRTMAVTLSCDHRVVDGALAGRFLAAIVPLLERPVALLV